MEPHTYKLWMCLQILAQHAPYRRLRSGDVQTTYRSLQDLMRVDKGDGGGRTYSLHTVQDCLKELTALGYIEVVSAAPGRGMVLRIKDWDKMQGQHQPGYEYSRYEYPPEADDEPAF